MPLPREVQLLKDASGMAIHVEVSSGRDNIGTGTWIFATDNRAESKAICDFLAHLAMERIEAPIREMENRGRCVWEALVG